MTVHIRPATPEDAELVHRFVLALATYEREPEAVQVRPAELRAQLASERPPFECLLAEVDAEVVGFALFFHSYSTWRGRQGLYLEDLFVLPERRSLGVGRALLVHLARLARERGCARMEWSVLDWNELAIHFYVDLGAREMGEWRLWRLEGAALERLADSATG